MIVNFEFLDDEPIENMMTSLHFQVEKVVFFGYEDVIAKKMEVTERFLKKYCGVREVAFCALSKRDLQSVTKTMREAIAKEKNQNHQIFFDITGGEDLLLVAFGMMAESFSAPMHRFDIETCEVTEFCMENVTPISKAVPRQERKLNLDGYIEMYGGVINYHLQKDTKHLDNQQMEQDIENLWTISSKYKEKWNFFADFLRRCCEPDEHLRVDITGKQVLATLRKINRFRSVRELGRILMDCGKAGVLQEFVHTPERLSFVYKSEKMKDLLWDAGSILEMHTFMQERVGADDCRVGVHLDWDGVIYNNSMKDTVNEIDVLSLRGVVPTFISCKNGAVNQMALYELETVAERFGGKYAKKVIAAPQGLNETHALRAKEMKIEIR